MASRCKRGGADVGIVVVVSRSVLVMHKACFFFSKRVLAYTKRYNTCSKRFVPLPILVLSLPLVTTDMFFSFLKRKVTTERPF